MCEKYYTLSWSLPDGELIKTLVGHNAGVTSLAVSPDGKMLFSSGGNNGIKLWSLPDGELIKTIDCNEKDFFASDLLVTPDGKMLIAAAGFCVGRTKVFELPSCDYGKDIEISNVLALSITPDCSRLFASHESIAVNTYCFPEGKFITNVCAQLQYGNIGGPTHLVFALAMTQDGRILISGDNSGFIKFWSLPDHKLIKTIDGHKSAIFALALSPDGRTLISGGRDKMIKFWDVVNNH